MNRGSAAARAGLRPRDLIVEIDREPVRDIHEYEEALEDADERALLLVRRNNRGQLITDIVALRIPE